MVSATHQPLQRARRPARPAAVLGRVLPTLVLYAVLLIVVAVIAAPFLWMISNAFKDQTAIYANPPAWLPSPVITDNFVSAWTQVPFPLFFLNSSSLQ